MKRCLILGIGLVLGIGLAFSAGQRAFAQTVAAGASARPFNPFASFSLSRFSFNTLGFLRVQPAATTTPTPLALGDGEDELPQAVVVRPPYRPPVRSPYRPPPRPPF